MTTPTQVLVAIDLPTSPDELDTIATHALSNNWAVHLFHAVMPTPPATAGSMGMYLPEHDVTTIAEQEMLDEYAEVVRSQGVTVTSNLEIGVPVDRIVDEALHVGAAMIVVSGKKHNLVHRIVLGSTVQSLLKVATLPVTVLPTEEHERGLDAAIDRFFDVAERSPQTDDIQEVRDAADEHRSEPDSPTGRERLQNAILEVEKNHPELTKTAREIAYLLRGLGI